LRTAPFIGANSASGREARRGAAALRFAVRAGFRGIFLELFAFLDGLALAMDASWSGC
jgi:hypothetical protein